MAKNIFPQANSAKFTATPEYQGDFVEFGTGAAQDECGSVVLQFAPSFDFEGEFIVMGRYAKSPAQQVTAPFIPIPYIAVCVNNVASDRHHSAEPIVGNSLIEVPSSGVSVAVLVSCSAGSCDIYISRVAGTPVAL